MSNLLSESLLIGSSNVYRLYKPSKTARDYKMVKCTKAESFEAHMSNLVPGNKFVLISVIENFLADEVTNEEEPEAEMTHCLNTFLKIIEEAAVKLPATKICIVMPTLRPCHEWYQDQIKGVEQKLTAGVKSIQTKIGFGKIFLIECSPETSQDFEADGTHLTEPSMKIFLSHILHEAESFFKGAQGTAAEDDEDVEVLRTVEERLDFLEKAHKKQVKMNFANNLIMARTREEIDTIGNRAKEDRVVISGLKSKSAPPAEMRARIEWLKELAMKIFNELVPNFPGNIFYLSQGKQAEVPLPMIEVKLDKPEHALAIRKAFAVKRKSKVLPPDLESLFITNCVSLATRVRIDILKAIAKKVTNDKDLAYVSGFISRPMMHIKKVGAPQNVRPLKSFTFIDSVTRFHGALNKNDLTTAYERAGRAFQGQLEPNFVVLNDEDQTKSTGHAASGSSARGGGKWKGRGKGGASGSAASGANATPRGSGATKGLKRSGSNLESETAKK
jgi:hypothetical protein